MTKLIGDDVKMFIGDWNGDYVELTLHDAPPLAPEPPAFAPSTAQLHFLRLHTFHCVEKWQWHWFNTMLRATTDRGVTATLWADSVEELIREGLMEAGKGFCMEVTPKGREACKC